MNSTKTKQRQGFTLIELLTVIAVIAVLATIIIPVVGRVRDNANATATKGQFGQWESAFELFRQEYGYFPDFEVGDGDKFLVNGESTPASLDETALDGTLFYEVLAGRIAAGANTGDRVEEDDPGYEAGNTRAVPFYDFAEYEVVQENDKVIIKDRFENGDIVVLFDLNQDGVIRVGSGNRADYSEAVSSLPEVRSVRSGDTFRPTTDQIPDEGVRAGVLFYSAGAGRDLLMSWR